MTSEARNLQINSLLTRRQHLAKQLGMSFGGKRDLYEALGYPKEMTYADYLAKYKRSDIAKAIIDRPAKATWRGQVGLTEKGKRGETSLTKEWDKLCADQDLKKRFQRADVAACIGEYSVLLLGLRDAKKANDWAEPAKTTNQKLLYVKPLTQAYAGILKFDEDPKSRRFGLPLLYSIRTGAESSDTLTVHYTRIIHIVRDRLESEVRGAPLLESVYNRVVDLEKLIGGSAEIFWKNARQGFAGKLDKDYGVDDDFMGDVQEQIDEYSHDLRRFLIAEGLELKSLETTVASPEAHVEAQIQMIAAVTGIPKRILTGSERGELSSAQDLSEWMKLVQERREEFAESEIVRPFVDRMKEFGILPKGRSEYFVSWPDLHTISDKEKAEVGKERAEALKKYTDSNIPDLVPVDEYMRIFVGLDDEEIAEIQEARLKEIEEEGLDADPPAGATGVEEDDQRDDEDRENEEPENREN